MTRVINETRTCAMCGKESAQRMCLSVYSCGYTGLDLRDPGTSSMTMGASYEKCPHCGYIGTSIEEEPKDPAYMKKLVRKKLLCPPLGIITLVLLPIATDLYRLSLLFRHEGNVEWEFRALLYTIWICDERFDRGTARRLRKRLLKLFDRLDDNIEPTGDARVLMKADIMRRAHKFRKVVAEFSDVTLEDEELNKALAFEVQLAKQRDDDEHDMHEVPE